VDYAADGTVAGLPRAVRTPGSWTTPRTGPWRAWSLSPRHAASTSPASRVRPRSRGRRGGGGCAWWPARRLAAYHPGDWPSGPDGRRGRRSCSGSGRAIAGTRPRVISGDRGDLGSPPGDIRREPPGPAPPRPARTGRSWPRAAPRASPARPRPVARDPPRQPRAVPRASPARPRPVACGPARSRAAPPGRGRRVQRIRHGELVAPGEARRRPGRRPRRGRVRGGRGAHLPVTRPRPRRRPAYGGDRAGGASAGPAGGVGRDGRHADLRGTARGRRGPVRARSKLVDRRARGRATACTAFGRAAPGDRPVTVR